MAERRSTRRRLTIFGANLSQVPSKPLKLLSQPPIWLSSTPRSDEDRLAVFLRVYIWTSVFLSCRGSCKHIGKVAQHHPRGQGSIRSSGSCEQCRACRTRGPDHGHPGLIFRRLLLVFSSTGKSHLVKAPSRHHHTPLLLGPLFK